MADPHSLAYRALDRHVIHGRADEIALAGHGPSMTYAQLLHDSACIAGAMREIGVAHGSTVWLDLPTGRERVIALLACVRLSVEFDEDANYVLSGNPAVLATPVTEVPWDVLIRAGRIDPAPAPATDPEGYERRILADHADVLTALIAGDTLV